MSQKHRASGLKIGRTPVHHPGNMDILPAAAHAEETAPPQLPSGLSPADFDPRQNTIIADWYADHLRHLADGFYAILRAMPPGMEPTPRRIGINAAILAKLLALTEDIEATTWHEMPEILQCRRADFCAQKNAVLAALRNRDHSLILRRR